MYCKENEFDSCKWSVRSQDYPEKDFFTLENKLNLEAHIALYRTFSERADDYDLFLKLDADMVLSSPGAFNEISAFMKRYDHIDDLQLALHDFFTDTRIYGLHVFRSGVEMNITDKDNIFVDLAVYNSGKRYDDNRFIAPIAYHSPNPSLFQSFHFGVHKAVKIVQEGRDIIDRGSRRVHAANILSLEEQWIQRHDRRLGIALIGAASGIVNEYNHEWVDFNNEKTIQEFSKYDGMSVPELQKVIDDLGPFKGLLNAYRESSGLGESEGILKPPESLPGTH